MASDPADLQLRAPADLPKTSLPDTSWWPSPETMKLQLAEIDKELNLMVRSLALDPALSDEDMALYQERYEALKTAHTWLSEALPRAEKRRGSKSGFRTTRIGREAFL